MGALPISLLFPLLAVFVLVSVHADDFRVVCYYTNLSQYRHGKGKFIPSDIDPSLCTHIVYGYADLVLDPANRQVELGVADPVDESQWSRTGYQSFRETIEPYPDVKRLLAVGGLNSGPNIFILLVRIPGGIKHFAEASITFLRERKFQGLVLHWQYQGVGNGPAFDKERFTAIVRQLRLSYAAEASRTGRSRLLVTLAVSAKSDIIQKGYEINLICRHADFLNVLTYNFRDFLSKKIGHHTQLYAGKDSSFPSDSKYNVDYAMKIWSKDCPKKKLNVGLAFHAQSFTMINGNMELNAAAGAGNPGPFTTVLGYLCYYEICSIMNQGGITKYLPEQKVFYVVKGNQWIGTITPRSIRYKVCYAIENGYGGVMVGSLDCDDFLGESCNQGKYPLLKAITYQLQRGGECTQPNKMDGLPIIKDKERSTLPPTSTTEGPVEISIDTLSRPRPDSVKTRKNKPSEKKAYFNETFCAQKTFGLYSNPKECSTFYLCVFGNSYLRVCPIGQLFSTRLMVCDDEAKVNCSINN